MEFYARIVGTLYNVCTFVINGPHLASAGLGQKYHGLSQVESSWVKLNQDESSRIESS